MTTIETVLSEPKESFKDIIIFSGPKTIVIWSDGSKTIVSCSENDMYDGYAGFCAAVAKKMFGSTSQVKKIIEKYTKEGK